MPLPSQHLHPSLESSASVGEPVHLRHSLFDAKDDFISRVSPLAVAAIYFGSFSLAPQDAALSCQALFKLSFLHRHFLQPGGLRIVIQRQTAILSGTVTGRALVMMGDILARQIEGIRQVRDETDGQKTIALQESIQLLFATDQTLRSGVQVTARAGGFTLDGEVSSAAQKSWAEQLVEAVGGQVDSRLEVVEPTSPKALTVLDPPAVDDESLQALVLSRLRLVRETEHLPVRVKATRGTVSLQGKVRTEALRQRAENLARATLGLRELRSSLSVAE